MSGFLGDCKANAGSYPAYKSVKEMLMDIVERVKKSQPNERYFRNGRPVDSDTYFHNLLRLHEPARSAKKPLFQEPSAPTRPLAPGLPRHVPLAVSEGTLKELRDEYEGKTGWVDRRMARKSWDRASDATFVTESNREDGQWDAPVLKKIDRLIH